MKKFLFAAAMVASFSNLCAATNVPDEWRCDLEKLTATRNVSEFIETKLITINMDNFGNSSVAVLKSLLPVDALANQWYEVKRMGQMTIEGESARRSFSVNYLLQFTETVTVDKHAHYKTGIMTPSGINDVVVRYPVYECTQTTTVLKILAKLAKAPEADMPFLLATQSILGAHVPGSAVLNKDGSSWMPTNPGEQSFVSGIITPDPNGVGEPKGNAIGAANETAAVFVSETERVAAQVANTAVTLGKQAKNLGKKLGFKK